MSNSIPSGETAVTPAGTYNNIGGSTVNDLGDLFAAVQTPGVPNLTITQSGSSVIVTWPNTGSYTLQQNSNLAVSAAWATSGFAVTTNSPNGTNSITNTLPTGSLFFRLANP
ncbi:MAG: hypothetical protein ABSA83_23940 [Verrucomicrobiota bacterium]|jgi:hypothetical protein